MGTPLEKSGHLMFDRGGPDGPATQKPKNYEELGLCLALIALVAWALYASLNTLDWQAVGHAFKAFLSVV